MTARFVDEVRCSPTSSGSGTMQVLLIEQEDADLSEPPIGCEQDPTLRAVLFEKLRSTVVHLGQETALNAPYA